MTRHFTRGVLAVVCVLALCAVSAEAQEDPDGLSSTAPSSGAATPGFVDADTPLFEADFGSGNTAITTLTWQAFLPRETPTQFDGAVGVGRWVTAGTSSYLYAALDRGMVPNGAQLTQIVFIINDSDGTSDVTGRLCWEATDSGNGANPGFDCPFSVTSSGTPGRGEIFGNPDTQILYRQDVDGDSTVENVSYHLSVNLPSQSSANAIHQVRMLWQRRVSNAPSAATFGDVPTTSGIFPFVEALVDSGVTSGCGGGNYCPNDPLTRGQMAVFLSAALGLNWDWTQTEPNP